MALVLTDKASSECFELRLKGCAWWHSTTWIWLTFARLKPLADGFTI